LFKEHFHTFFKHLRQSSSIPHVLSIALLTISVKIVAALKEIAVAYRYGVSNELDAYLIAFMYGSFMVNILAGSFSAALVPVYIRTKAEQGKVSARNLLSSLTGWSGIVFIGSALFLLVMAKWLIPIVATGFDLQTMSLTLKMIPILITLIIFFGISSIWSPVINSHNSFMFPALTPVLPSLAIIGFVFICPKGWGGYSLALGTAVGYLLETILLGCWLIRFDLSPVPTLHISKSLRNIGIQLLPLMLAAMMSTGMGVVDQSMAAMLEKGSVAALNFGYRIVGVVFSLSAAIWIVALPKFSFLASEEDYSSMRRSLMLQIGTIMIFTLPLVVCIIIFSRPIVALVFERGAFTSSDTIIVSLVQSFYIIQAPFFICSGLMMRMLSSINQNRALMWGGALALGMNIMLNIIFIKFFKVAGIALSTSIVSVISFCYLFYILSYKLKDLQRRIS
jgi:putative peptidoglycan lipid II flippase